MRYVRKKTLGKTVHLIVVRKLRRWMYHFNGVFARYDRRPEIAFIPEEMYWWFK